VALLAIGVELSLALTQRLVTSPGLRLAGAEARGDADAAPPPGAEVTVA
jgi:hypothetical protein